MKQTSFISVLVVAAYVTAAADAALGEPGQITSADGKLSQALSLNISELPIAKYVHQVAQAAYAPDKFELGPDEKVLAAVEGSNGFKALAVEMTFGTQKLAIPAFSGTDPLSVDMLADTQIGLEAIVYAANPDLGKAQARTKEITEKALPLGPMRLPLLFLLRYASCFGFPNSLEFRFLREGAEPYQRTDRTDDNNGPFTRRSKVGPCKREIQNSQYYV